MKIKTLFFFFLIANQIAQAQVPRDQVVKWVQTITAEDLKEHVTILASDDYEGRETGTPGQRKAADYIAGQFNKLEIPKIVGDSTYFQPILFAAHNWKEINLSINGTRLEHLKDYYAFPNSNIQVDSLDFDKALFVGYGIESANYSDYGGKSAEGRLLIMYTGLPTDAEGTPSLEIDPKFSDPHVKIRVAAAKGAAAVLFIDTDFKNQLAEARKSILNTRLQLLGPAEFEMQNRLPNYYISTEVARQLVGKKVDKLIKKRDRISQKGKPGTFSLPVEVGISQEKSFRSLEGSNVLGYIEGTEPELKEELVIITAHYDHLGKRGNDVYNGADDNGSGTSTVLEIAEAFVTAKKTGSGPRRSVLCMLVSGEEKGLLGSQYYSENPVFPLENTIVNVNVDMVGRVDEKHAEDPNYIYVIGADRLSSELHEINEQANATYTQLELDYTYNDEGDPNRYYYRSDHYNFAKKGIPAIFYFNGTHEDYHRTTDTVEKINFEKMETIGRLVFYTSWELANRDKRIVVDKQ